MKAPYGTHASVFWGFYESHEKTMKKMYHDGIEARRAGRSMLVCKNRKGIREVSIKQRGNMLYLERTDGNGTRDH